MGEEHRFTQVGKLTIVMMLLAAVFTAFMFYSGLKSDEGQDATILKVSGFVVACVFVFALASFNSFTIQIAAGKLSFWFGFGVVRNSFPLEEIRSVETVENPWYYLWGIKSIPGGWLYSITPGGRVIEVIFKDNKKIQLGTSQPEEIKQILDKAVGIAN